MGVMRCEQFNWKINGQNFPAKEVGNHISNESINDIDKPKQSSMTTG